MGSTSVEQVLDIITIEGVPTPPWNCHQQFQTVSRQGLILFPAAAIGQGIQINNVLGEHLESFIAKT